MTTHGHPPIVVTVDQPPIGRDAALWSARLAERLHCTLRVVYIAAATSDVSADIAATGPEAAARTESSATAVVDDTIAVVRRDHPDLEISGELIDGPAAQALATVGEDARMVVLGHPDVGALDVPTATTMVTEHATCPVTVWRGEPGQLPDQRPVLLAVDDDIDGADAALAAFGYAHLFGASVIAVNAQPEQPGTAAPVTSTNRHSLDAHLAVARDAFPDVTVSALADIPHRSLNERATGAQLVVTGPDGRASVPEGPGFGSYFFRRSRCPVMICPSRMPPVGLGADPIASTANTAPAPSTPLISGMTVRALTPDDRDAVASLHEQMSAHDAYLRFFSAPPKRIDEFAEQLCRHDSTHLALGAFEGDDLVGVANYVVTDTTAGHLTAEMALAVNAHDQQHGIGTLLVRRLGTAAYLQGVKHLTAEILAENTLMLAIITEQGWNDALRYEGATVHFDLELDAHGQEDPGTPVLPRKGNAGQAIRKGR
ncbi:GNAT family N-acetyltransferase [Nocardia amamiensis]|uniref:GNAT family N-acetyltransferase n=1 Tax=Nocardia amamiensis TaxID=404578 RepID=A0ABS0CXM8_9NOCA|nr:GNAT family N-acetyltransferase [Nocardia amamiensis]MBF6301341.1 GNAT family N-acetyltransferase [Nocardia amamiensis]